MLNNQHHYLADAEMGVLNAQAVARVAISLKETGFEPDVMLGHNGWGEIWYLKDVYPDTPLIGYFEFFYRFQGADVGFDPQEPAIFDTAPRIRTKNLGNLLALDAVDFGQTATQWQRSLYPAVYQDKLHAIHEGIDTNVVVPKADARLRLSIQLPHPNPPPGGEGDKVTLRELSVNAEIELSQEDEVLTYVARNLEPYRGFPQFMRSLPAILAQRPQAQVLIVGGDEPSYGHRLPQGQTHRQLLMKELGDTVDWKRVHFLGKVPYSTYLTVLQISRVHVYLTYPFVLSWSLLEAMSAGCLLVASKTAPVEEVIRDGENGLLVDFFKPDEIAQKVVATLAAGRNGYAELRQNARRAVVANYDLKTICLPAHLQLLEKAIKCN